MKLLTSIILNLTVISGVYASDWTAQWGSGNYRDLYVKDGLAWVAAGNGGLDLLDVHNPENPLLLTNDTRHQVYSITGQGEIIALAAGADGLVLLDVSNPFRSEIVDTLLTSEQVLDVVLDGDYAYLANGLDGLSVVALDVPEHSKRIARLSLPGPALSLSQEGDTLYLACGPAGLVVVDISIPEAPELVDQVPLPYAGSVSAHNGLALVSGGDNGLFLVDVTVPGACVLAGTLDMVAQTAAFDSMDAAFVAGENGLAKVDIRNPEMPFIEHRSPSAGNIGALALAEDIVLSAAYQDGLKIFDRSSTQVVLGGFDRSGYALSVCSGEVYTLMADPSSERVQVFATGSTSLLASLDVGGVPLALAPMETGAVALVLDRGLVTLDLDSNEIMPRTIQLPGTPRALAVEEDMAVIAAGDAGLHIVRGLPNDPHFYKTIPLPQGAQKVAISGHRALVTTGHNSLLTIDLELGGVTDIQTLSSQARSVSILGNEAFVTTYDAKLHIYDFTGSSPVARSVIRLPHTPMSLTAKDNRLYLPVGNDGLLIYDRLTDRITQLQTPGDTREVSIVGDHLYVTDGSSGKLLYRREGNVLPLSRR